MHNKATIQIKVLFNSKTGGNRLHSMKYTAKTENRTSNPRILIGLEYIFSSYFSPKYRFYISVFLEIL